MWKNVFLISPSGNGKSFLGNTIIGNLNEDSFSVTPYFEKNNNWGRLRKFKENYIEIPTYENKKEKYRIIETSSLIIDSLALQKEKVENFFEPFLLYGDVFHIFYYENYITKEKLRLVFSLLRLILGEKVDEIVTIISLESTLTSVENLPSYKDGFVKIQTWEVSELVEEWKLCPQVFYFHYFFFAYLFWGQSISKNKEKELKTEKKFEKLLEEELKIFSREREKIVNFLNKCKNDTLKIKSFFILGELIDKYIWEWNRHSRNRNSYLDIKSELEREISSEEFIETSNKNKIKKLSDYIEIKKKEDWFEKLIILDKRELKNGNLQKVLETNNIDKKNINYFSLADDCSWLKKYSKFQLFEWGWEDTKNVMHRDFDYLLTKKYQLNNLFWDEKSEKEKIVMEIFKNKIFYQDEILWRTKKKNLKTTQRNYSEKENLKEEKNKNHKENIKTIKITDSDLSIFFLLFFLLISLKVFLNKVESEYEFKKECKHLY